MGYTHYFRFNNKRGLTASNEIKYQKALLDIAKVAKAYNKQCEESGNTDERLSGYTAHAKIGQYGGAKFNGKGDLAHEDFVLREHLLENSDFNFCKTDRKPYDVVVIAALSILKHRLGDAVTVSSDGDKLDWNRGVRLAREITGLKIVNPIADCYLDERPVEIIKVYLKGVDSYIDKAVFLDTGDELDDEQLDKLAETCQDYLIQQNVEHFGYYQK